MNEVHIFSSRLPKVVRITFTELFLGIGKVMLLSWPWKAKRSNTSRPLGAN